jgi:hypothetical protein
MVRTSDRVSSIAARYVNTTATDVFRAHYQSPADREQIAADIRAMAASCLRQDEHKGKRGLLRRLFG